MNIGVFDSGLGGLTILKGILEELPQYNYIYLGDNARVPYGNRSPEIIYQFTKQAVDFLFKKNCQLIIIACNTSSSTALKRIQNEYLPKNYPGRRVLGVIKPMIENIEALNKDRIGIIGTKATINSGAFVREIKKVLPEIKVFQKACPLLVPYIEDANKNEKILNLILHGYLDELKKENINVLVLACTHYEVIKDEIKKIAGSEIQVLSEGKIVALSLKNYLTRHKEVDERLEKNREVTYFVTDLIPDYEKFIKIFFKSGNTKKKIILAKLDQ